VSMLVSHELNGEDESSTIGASRVAQLCATDWGLWRTTKQNIARVREDLPEVPLSSENECSRGRKTFGRGSRRSPNHGGGSCATGSGTRCAGTRNQKGSAEQQCSTRW
jgi:hypothetical protein